MHALDEKNEKRLKFYRLLNLHLSTFLTVMAWKPAGV